jgi:hypothetical protein
MQWQPSIILSEEQGSMKVEPNRSKKRGEHRLPTVEGMGSHEAISP